MLACASVSHAQVKETVAPFGVKQAPRSSSGSSSPPAALRRRGHRLAVALPGASSTRAPQCPCTHTDRRPHCQTLHTDATTGGVCTNLRLVPETARFHLISFEARPMTHTTLIPSHAHHDSVGRGLWGACVHGGREHSTEGLCEQNIQTPFCMRMRRSYFYAANFTFTSLRPVTPWDVRLGRRSAIMGYSSFISYARCTSQPRRSYGHRF